MLNILLTVSCPSSNLNLIFTTTSICFTISALLHVTLTLTLDNSVFIEAVSHYSDRKFPHKVYGQFPKSNTGTWFVKPHIFTGRHVTI